MQKPNFDTIAQHPAVQKLFTAHAPKHACTANNVQSLAKQNTAFRTALTLLMNSELEKHQYAQAHQASCDEACQWQRAHDAQAAELAAANEFRKELVNQTTHFNETGKNADEKEPKDYTWKDWVNQIVKGGKVINDNYINPDKAKEEKEAETKKQNESNSWIWWGVGALGLLLGGLWYFSSNKKTA